MATTRYRAGVYEIDSVELDVPTEVDLDADNIYFTGTYFDSDNVQNAIKELDFRQLLQEPTGFPNTTDSTISFTDATLTFSIAPVSGSFDYYISGVKYTVSSEDTATITDTEGMWFIYYDGATLTTSQTPWDIRDHVPVAILYWDADNDEVIFFGEERHGLTMDNATHHRLHWGEGDGAKKRKGTLLIGGYTLRQDGSSNSHAQCSFSDGYLIDEDLEHAITNAASPSDPFEQKLSSIAYIPGYYFEGTAANPKLRKLTATAYPCATDAGNRIKYNKYDSGTDTWSLETVPNNYFVNSWFFATNNINEPIIYIVGQFISESLSEVDNVNLELITNQLPMPEFYALDRLIFKTSDSFTNTPKAATYSYMPLATVRLNNDRWCFIASYNGNAGVNRYLEFFPNIASNDAPMDYPDNNYMRLITIQCAANSTGTMGFYKVSDDSLVYEFSLSGIAHDTFYPSEFITGGTEIYLKVTSGSFSKPAVRVWNQTELQEEE